VKSSQAARPTASLARPEAPGPPEAGRPRTGRLLGSLRTRLVAWFGLVLLLALLGSLAAARWVLLNRLDARIDADLALEVEELRALADEVDPDTGRVLGEEVRRLFEVYLQRNVPQANEALITFVDGEPFLRSSPVVPYRLDLDREVAPHWASLTETERSVIATPVGSVRYLAVPVRINGDTQGVYVGAFFRDLEAHEVDDALASIGVVGLVALAVGCLLAAALANRILTPVAQVTATAQRISETDFSQRIEVTGRDEIAALAGTFNDMLERLEEAFEAQRRFIDDVGHELRTPLTIVQGHLEQLGDDPQQREATLALVQDEHERMGRLVGDLLVLARAGRPDFLDLGLVDLGELTRELYGKASALGPRRWQLDDVPHGRIVADRQRLTQAVMQLAENAVRQTARDDAIAIGAAIVDGMARLWVRDSGPGIPHEEQQALFDRFRTAGRRDGLGLGLSIVKAIAEAHSGHVELRSRPGAGATFTLVVPTDQPEGALP
jgi:two-component system, OmpR family, sensor kinase